MVGTVVNAQSLQPMADVVVTVTSPEFPGDLVVRTDAQGTYRVPELSPGVYTLVFEKEPYQPFMRDDVRLRLNRTLRVNVALPLVRIDEPVEVIGKPPLIDDGAGNTCLTINEEFVKCGTALRPVARGKSKDSDASRSEPEAVTVEPSVRRASPRYNLSPTMPGMSMTLRLHPVPSEEALGSPRRGAPPSRASPSSGSEAPVPESSLDTAPVDLEFIRRIAVTHTRAQQEQGARFIGTTPEAIPCPPASANVPNLHYGMTRDGMVLTHHTRWMCLEQGRRGGRTYESVARCC
nr:carboxypeptidase regulatory-like domain-containing protein [Myxococcus sp. AM011]